MAKSVSGKESKFPIIHAIDVESSLAKPDWDSLKESCEKAFNQETLQEAFIENAKKPKESESVEFFNPVHISEVQRILAVGGGTFMATEYLNTALRKHGTVVYNFATNTDLWAAEQNIDKLVRCKMGLLINIQPIQKEEPDSWKKIGLDLAACNYDIVEVAKIQDRAHKLAEKK